MCKSLELCESQMSKASCICWFKKFLTVKSCKFLFLSMLFGFFCLLWDIQLHGQLLQLWMDEQKDFTMQQIYMVTQQFLLWKGHGKPNL